MYRNYDGQGSQFGNIYLKSATSDDTKMAVYGARRSSDGAITILVINKTTSDLTSKLTLSGIRPSGNAQIYTYSAANTSAIVHQSDLPVSADGVTSTFAADSLTLLAIPTNGQHHAFSKATTPKQQVALNRSLAKNADKRRVA